MQQDFMSSSRCKDPVALDPAVRMPHTKGLHSYSIRADLYRQKNEVVTDLRRYNCRLDRGWFTFLPYAKQLHAC